MILGIREWTKIDKAGDQNCCELRDNKLECQIPIQNLFHELRNAEKELRKFSNDSKWNI
jgi:hypothetical protein